VREHHDAPLALPTGRNGGSPVSARAVVAIGLVGVALAGCKCSELLGSEPATVVPSEVADEAALAGMSDWAALPVLRNGRYRQQSSEDRETGDPVPIPLWGNRNRDMNNFVCASEDAEPRRSGVRFVVDLEQCPERYVRGYVLARFEGAGRLARIWMTAASVRRQPADQEVLRIYVDDAPTPVVQVPLSKALDGSAGEIFARPFGAGTSRYLAWYYPVVFATKLIVSLDRLDLRDLYFHQTSVVLDADQKPRQGAPERLAARDRVLRLLRSEVPLTGKIRSKRLSLTPGQTVTAYELEGPATVVSTRVRVARARLAALQDVELTVRWDHAEQAAIALPVLRLFAASEAVPEHPSLALSAASQGDDVQLDLRLPMPFRSHAEWTLTNRADQPIDLGLALAVTASVPSSRWGYLHAQHFETALPYRRSHPLASARGAGRLVGACLLMRGHGAKMRGMAGHPMNFLEGDELGLVDGERAMAGTGTEDYFNGAFYFEDGANATPFAQVWDIFPGDPKTRGQARTSACRWHVLGDAVDFASSLDLEMEIGPGDPDVLDRYRSVAFLYLAAD
jgi:hypothetical protein